MSKLIFHNDYAPDKLLSAANSSDGPSGFISINAFDNAGREIGAAESRIHLTVFEGAGVDYDGKDFDAAVYMTIPQALELQAQLALAIKAAVGGAA